MGDLVIININGTDYYVPSNMIQYLTENGVNTSNNTFYGYTDLSNATSNRYPQIRFNSLAYPIVYNGYNNFQELQNPTISFSREAYFHRFTSYIPIVEIMLLGCIFVAVFFRRFHRW